MGTFTQETVALLGGLNAAIQLPTAFHRRVAYRAVLSNATRDELIELCGVLCEGNAYGSAAAREMAGAS